MSQTLHIINVQKQVMHLFMFVTFVYQETPKKKEKKRKESI
jgi:hypothetical protein